MTVDEWRELVKLRLDDDAAALRLGPDAELSGLMVTARNLLYGDRKGRPREHMRLATALDKCEGCINYRSTLYAEARGKGITTRGLKRLNKLERGESAHRCLKLTPGEEGLEGWTDELRTAIEAYSYTVEYGLTDDLPIPSLQPPVGNLDDIDSILHPMTMTIVKGPRPNHGFRAEPVTLQ